MAYNSGIEWCDATWNPVRGCTRVSEGCRNCYAETVAARFSGPGQPYHGFADPARSGSKWTGRVELVPHMLDLPLRWRRPRRIFVNSMSDLFHESLSDDAIDRVFAVMALAPQHTFQILTKRAARMRRYFAGIPELPNESAARDAMIVPDPNVWLGVSVENQEAADERIPDLLAIPAAVRFLSCEPLLGPIDLGRWLKPGGAEGGRSWVIAGGESGPGARPMHPDWARGLRDQCTSAGVPFFFKQWGEWLAGRWQDGQEGQRNDSREWRHFGTPGEQGAFAVRVGKKTAGALLDGHEWKEFPDVRPTAG